MIQAGHPVFFGCDVGQFSDSASGVMDTALFEYEVSHRPPVFFITVISFKNRITESIQHHSGPDESRTAAGERNVDDARDGHLGRARRSRVRAACAVQGREFVGRNIR